MGSNHEKESSLKEAQSLNPPTAVTEIWVEGYKECQS